MSIIILKQGGLVVVVCVWAQQEQGKQRKRLWVFFYTGRGMKIPQINTKYFPHKKIKFKEGP